MKLNNKNNFKIIIRWIAIFPTAVFAYFLVKALSDGSTSRFFYELVRDVNTGSGFGGHYISGSMYLFQREFAATLGSFYASLAMAPKYKRHIYFIITGLYIVILITGSILSYYIVTDGLYNWTSEHTIRSIIETVAQIFAILIIGGALLKGELFEKELGLNKNKTLEVDPIQETPVDFKRKKERQKMLFDASEEKAVRNQKESADKPLLHTIEILGVKLSEEHFPALYHWAQKSPDMVRKSVQGMMEKQGFETPEGAMIILESDTSHF